MEKKIPDTSIFDVEPTVCDCEVCRRFCKHRPCWPTPEEALAIMAAGYGNRLMLDYWVGSPNTELVCPAIVGHEGTDAPSWPKGQCNMQDDDGLCVLHDAGLKPIEGRIAHHSTGWPENGHEETAMLWDTKEGRTVVERWKAEYWREGEPDGGALDILMGVAGYFDNWSD